MEQVRRRGLLTGRAKDLHSDPAKIWQGIFFACVSTFFGPQTQKTGKNPAKSCHFLAGSSAKKYAIILGVRRSSIRNGKGEETC